MVHAITHMPTMMSLARRFVICNFKGHQIAKNLQVIQQKNKMIKAYFSSVKSAGMKSSKHQNLFTCNVNYSKL